MIKANRWSCEITAYAMAMNEKVATIEKIIGHNGGEIAWPGFREPACRRGFHHQELIMAAMKLGFTVTPFELIPAIAPTPGQHPVHEGRSVCHPLVIDDPLRRQMFKELIASRRGVLTGQCSRTHHAVAFYMGQIIDPDGDTYPHSFEACEAKGFYGNCLWIIECR
jgi:hypothetical protein